MKKTFVVSFVVAVMIAAGALRFARLSQRPLHTDEAVHAVKYSNMLDGTYHYDPYEYHGPILNYLTCVIARYLGQARFQDVTEFTLRAGPALMGTLLVLLPLGLWGLVDKRVIGLTMVFTAVSPAMVFYSRYYIQETFLVLFTAGLLISVLRYLNRPHWGYAVCAGLCAGLMHATKETCVIAYAALVLAVVLTRPRHDQEKRAWYWRHVAAFGVAGVFISTACFTQGFQYAQGIWDSIATYITYFQRAGHEGAKHHHHWFYYLDLLTWVEFVEWPGWNEDYTVIGAFLGGWWAFRQVIRSRTQSWAVQCVAVFTLVTLIVYSLIQYKTPWCMMTFLYGMIVLAAVGTVELVHWFQEPGERKAIWGFMAVLGVMSPLGQAVAQNFVYDADQTNPYVYAHTHRDIYRVSDTLHRLIDRAPKNEPPVIQVVCPDKDYWPLPWYMRDYERVGYYTAVDMNQPPGDIVLFQPSVTKDMQTLLFEVYPKHELYVNLFDEPVLLRPGVPWGGYVRKSLWDAQWRADHE